MSFTGITNLKRKEDFQYLEPEKKQKTVVKEMKGIEFNEIQKDFTHSLQNIDEDFFDNNQIYITFEGDNFTFSTIEIKEPSSDQKDMDVSNKEPSSEILSNIEEEEKGDSVSATLNEFQSELISKFEPKDSFEQRICQFGDYTKGTNNMYIDLGNEKWVLLIIKKIDKFESEAFKEDFFMEKHHSNPQYYQIQLHEYCPVNGDKQVLALFISNNGMKNELIKVEKGREMTGTDVMKIFEEKIVPWFNLKKFFLYDDAKKIYGPNLKKDFISMRKNDIFLKEGKSWYERQGFTLHPCQNVQMEFKDDEDSAAYQLTYNQDPDTYLAAKEELCKTRLDSVAKYLESSTSDSKRLMSLKNKYFPSVNPTLQEFVGELNAKANPRDLNFFLEKCLNGKWAATSPKLINFLRALRVIEDARIYEKEYKTPK